MFGDLNACYGCFVILSETGQYLTHVSPQVGWGDDRQSALRWYDPPDPFAACLAVAYDLLRRGWRSVVAYDPTLPCCVVQSVD